VKPAAYLHTLHMELEQKSRRLSFEEESPFGVRGRDYSDTYETTVEPLYSLADVELEQLQAENRRLADEVSDLSAFIEGLKQHVVAAAKMYGQGRMK